MSTDPSQLALERIETIIGRIDTRPKLTMVNPGGGGNVQTVRQQRQRDTSRTFDVIATSLPEEDEMAGYVAQRWRLEGAVEVRLTRGTRDRRALRNEILKLGRLIVEAMEHPTNWQRTLSGIDNIITEPGTTSIEDDGAAIILTVPFTVIYTEL